MAQESEKRPQAEEERATKEGSYIRDMLQEPQAGEYIIRELTPEGQQLLDTFTKSLSDQQLEMAIKLRRTQIEHTLTHQHKQRGTDFRTVFIPSPISVSPEPGAQTKHIKVTFG